MSSSLSSTHEEAGMAADVQELVKPFVENEDDVIEIMRLLSGLGASVLLHSGIDITTVNTVEDFGNKIKLVRARFASGEVARRSKVKDQPHRKVLPAASRRKPTGREPQRRGGGGGPLRKPDHTWRDGDPYVFHAPRVEGGTRDQLPVPTDPEIRDRYPWWWSVLGGLAPPDDTDNDDNTVSKRSTVTSSARREAARSSSLGSDFHVSSSSSTLGSRTRAYLEEELSHPLSVSGVTDLLHGTGSTSGYTYQTAEEEGGGNASVSSSRGARGWRLEMDPMEFNKERNPRCHRPVSSRVLSVAYRGIACWGIVQRQVLSLGMDSVEEDIPVDDTPVPSISLSSPTATSAHPGGESSLMEIIDDWQKELRDLRHARVSASGIPLAPLTKQELLDLRQQAVDRNQKVESTEPLSGLRADVAVLEGLLDESRRCREKQKLLIEQRYELEQEKMNEVKALLTAKFAESHEDLRRVFKETFCGRRDELQREWVDRIDESSSDWASKCGLLGERLATVSEGTAKESEERKRHIDGSVGDAFLQKIEELRGQIAECSEERRRHEEEWDTMRERLFGKVRRSVSEEKQAREDALNGIRMSDALQTRKSRARHKDDEERIAADLDNILHTVNAELHERTSREVCIIHNLGTFLQQFEENCRANVAKQQEELIDDMAAEDERIKKLREFTLCFEYRDPLAFGGITLMAMGQLIMNMTLLAALRRGPGNILTPLATPQQCRYRHFLTPGLHRRWNFRSFPHLGEAIRFARASKKIPVAKLMHATLIPERRLLQIQQGMVKPHLFELQVLEKYLGVPFYDKKKRKSYIDRAVLVIMYLHQADLLMRLPFLLLLPALAAAAASNSSEGSCFDEAAGRLPSNCCGGATVGGCWGINETTRNECCRDTPVTSDSHLVVASDILSENYRGTSDNESTVASSALRRVEDLPQVDAYMQPCLFQWHIMAAGSAGDRSIGGSPIPFEGRWHIDADWRACSGNAFGVPSTYLMVTLDTSEVKTRPFGLCVPSVCSPEELKHEVLPVYLHDINVSLSGVDDVTMAEVSERELDKDGEGPITSSMLAMFILSFLAATYLGVDGFSLSAGIRQLTSIPKASNLSMIVGPLAVVLLIINQSATYVCLPNTKKAYDWLAVSYETNFTLAVLGVMAGKSTAKGLALTAMTRAPLLGLSGYLNHYFGNGEFLTAVLRGASAYGPVERALPSLVAPPSPGWLDVLDGSILSNNHLNPVLWPYGYVMVISFATLAFQQARRLFGDGFTSGILLSTIAQAAVTVLPLSSPRNLLSRRMPMAGWTILMEMAMEHMPFAVGPISATMWLGLCLMARLTTGGFIGEAALVAGLTVWMRSCRSVPTPKAIAIVCTWLSTVSFCTTSTARLIVPPATAALRGERALDFVKFDCSNDHFVFYYWPVVVFVQFCVGTMIWLFYFRPMSNEVKSLISHREGLWCSLWITIVLAMFLLYPNRYSSIL
ncbi:hypothetical protein FOZ61_010159 [Perkinsus olseni]|uniref:Uncharacterized protein n=1 Tax=Perkinsus olseni TaxID=32597 RepID=A0A7J6MG48_PEROL|nr:hypothetical protein FOZ61_010159 [Perkinsus olseni]